MAQQENKEEWPKGYSTVGMVFALAWVGTFHMVSQVLTGMIPESKARRNIVIFENSKIYLPLKMLEPQEPYLCSLKSSVTLIVGGKQL